MCQNKLEQLKEKIVKLNWWKQTWTFAFFSSLSGMAQAVDCLSTSAPTTAESQMISSDFGPCIFIPGGFSYESTANPKAKMKGNFEATLKQAKGTGRQVCIEPNQKSYTQLKQEVQQTPGAEIRM